MSDLIQISHPVLMIAAFLSILAGTRYFQYRTPTTRWGGLYLLSLALELISFSLLLVTGRDSIAPAWFILQVTSFYFLILFWLLFISETAGLLKKIPFRLVLPILCIPPAIQAFLLGRWSLNPLRVNKAADFIGSLSRLPMLIGPYGSFMIILYYGMGTLSFILLVWLSFKSDSFFRKLFIPMLMGNILIFLLDIVDRSGFNLFESYYLIQFGLALMGISIFFSAYLWRFGGILPISRESVFEGIHDGVIILDYYDRVIDINLPAQKLLSLQKKTAVNRELSEVWEKGSRIIGEHPGELWIEERCDLLVDGQTFPFLVKIFQNLGLNNSPNGRLILLRNVSGGELMEEALEKRSLELERTNSLLETLASLSVRVQPDADASIDNDIVASGLTKLGLVYFVAELDPQTGELVMKYLSTLPEKIRWVERIIRNKVIGYRLDKDQFSTLYKRLETREIIFKKFNPEEIGNGASSIPADILEQAVRLVGLLPENVILGLPLVSDERALGLMGVWGRDLKESDVPAFQVFASQIAHMMEQVILHEAEQNQAGELARSNKLILALSNVASRLDAAADLPQVFSILGDELRKMGLKCMIGTLDDEKQNMRVEYVSVLDDLKMWSKKLGSIWPDEIVIPKRLWPTQKVTDEKAPFWDSDPVNNISRMFPGLPKFIFEKAFEMAGISYEDHVCYLPVISEDNPIGVFAVWGENLHKVDLHVLTIFSSQVASIIERLKSYDEEVQRSKQLMHTNAMVIALSNVAAQLDSTTDLKQIFEILGKELKKVQIHCMVGTLDDLKEIMKVEYLSDMVEVISKARKLKLKSPDEITIPRRLWPTEKAISEKSPYWDPNPIGNIHKMFPFIPKNIFLKAFTTAGLNPDDPVCYFPLINEEDVIGILAVWGPDLNPGDLQAFSIFANQLAMAIKTSKLYALAQNEILERTQAEGQIRSALEEKEILLKEIHHRVKNNLQIITSLLNLQAAEVADEKTLEALRESQNRLRSMALIHEKLYQSKDLARIDFAGYIESLVTSLSQTYKVKPEKIVFNVHSEPVTLNIDLAIPCGLIINELVSNSVKYAFPGNRTGVIQVKLARIRTGNWMLAISDNGIGLPAGFEINKSPSLGLNLVTNLVRQINGQFEIDGVRGTAYKISFNIK